MFSSDVYTRRREILKKRVGSGIILLPGNEESGINYADNHYHFRQDSTFLYYTGINKPHLAVIIDIDADKEILFGDEATIDELVWTGPVPSCKNLADSAGLHTHRPYDEMEKYLHTYRADRNIYFLPPYRPEHLLKLQKVLGGSNREIRDQVSVPLIKAIVDQRSYKTAEERSLIEEAVNITCEMHVEAMRSARPGMKEYEVMSRVHQKALEHNGQLSFPIILTVNGQTLHNHYYGNTLSDGDMVLCDAGAEIGMGYAGDMTRTFPVGKRFTNLQREIYDIVLQAQQSAIDALAPGIEFREVHLIACRKIFEGLKAVGLTKGDPHEAVEAGAHTLFFQCGLGHMMGLDVHDMENLGEEYVGYTDELKKSKEFGLKSLRLGRKLEPGFVVTVEPGIYIIPELIDQWKETQKHKAFINYDKLDDVRDFGGIRIEDDFIITEEGTDLLGNPLPKTVEEIEEIRRETLQEIQIHN
ncbi:MAG: aminopeptidase P family protein [Balneolaceae bacterium]|nr:aminopeptidase P family protein [Balneolaceae bacterium]